MPTSFDGLVRDAVTGRDSHPALVLSDARFADLMASLAAGDVVWVTSVSTADPVALGSPQTYMRLDENGKQQYCVRFKTGAIQVLATEP
jgi:hypothetical protein